MDEYNDTKKPMRPDAELVARALAGNADAFAPIVERYQDAVFGVALARLRNFHDAQDVAQRVFVEAYGRLDTLKDPARLGAWLRSIAVHRSIDVVRGRRAGVTSADELDEHPHPGPTPAAVLDRRDMRDRVLDAIGRLSTAQRETTTLFYINGYTIDEVAAMQEVPAGTVKRRLHDARARLKEEMMTVVADVLKSEAPKEDFAKRVFDLIAGHVPWRERVDQLRRIGSKGLGGFLKAGQSPDGRIRAMAVHMLQAHIAPQDDEEIIRMLKQAVGDRNRKVRRCAVEALINSSVNEARKAREFVPLILPLLGDPSKRVRRAAVYGLCDLAKHVPLDLVATRFLHETDPETRKRLELLMASIVGVGHGTVWQRSK
jgi:RNA polymerase sigma-70 factor (ECF subfamily)